MKFSRIALIGAATLAVAQPQHNHARLHAKRVPAVEARDAVHTTVVTVYQLNGVDLSYEEVQEGIEAGKYVIVGESLQSIAPAAPALSTPTTAPTSSASATAVKAAEFVEKPKSSSTTPVHTPSTTVVPTTSSTALAHTAPSSSAASSASSSSYSSSSGSGVDSEFPSGTIPCSTFPSAYGAIALPWLGLKGWAGIQQTSDYSSGASSIVSIVTGVKVGCEANSFCSYACPAGYQKSQWPTAQGSTGQSVGGLYCNSNGMLELSRPSYKTICQKGAGGITISNSLSKNVAICRTDYPGTESETIPLNCESGVKRLELTNPIAGEYYEWEGKPTSAQYYVNPSGTSVEDACQWGTAGSNMGNFAPMNIGVGTTSAGTFISIFQNAPTNTDGTLDFTVTITGDVTGKCEYKGGKFYSNGVISLTNGCTAGVTAGGSAAFEFS